MCKGDFPPCDFRDTHIPCFSLGLKWGAVTALPLEASWQLPSEGQKDLRPAAFAAIAGTSIDISRFAVCFSQRFLSLSGILLVRKYMILPNCVLSIARYSKY